ncbi:MAG: hypothetical protein H6R27_67 [Proteobacteria bacterium]|nr:hypothetical protein [Pseudomonadota bacterium]
MNAPGAGTRYLAASGAALAAIAAALAAVGSHALGGRLTPAELASFNTAVAFQFVNAIGLFAAAWARDRLPDSALARASGWLLLAGTLLFCGSIYAARLGLTASAGPTAPVGGSAVIVAWAGLAAALLRGR